MPNRTGARILTVEQLKQAEPLPESWTKAAGLLRHKRKALDRHLKRIRFEWDRVPSRA
jgi:hypothetical protein